MTSRPAPRFGAAGEPADHITAALEGARAAWLSSHDVRRLRADLARLLAELDACNE